MGKFQSGLLCMLNEIWNNKNKNFSQRKSPSPHGYTGELYQNFKEELILIFHKLFQEIEVNPSRLPYEASIAVIPKSDRDITIKERSIFLINIHEKILKKVLANWIQQHMKGFAAWPNRIYPRNIGLASENQSV